MGTAGMSPAGNQQDHEDSEFDVRKVWSFVRQK